MRGREGESLSGVVGFVGGLVSGAKGSLGGLGLFARVPLGIYKCRAWELISASSLPF